MLCAWFIALQAAALATSSASNCQFGWIPTFDLGTGLDDNANCMAVFDDGAGPRLYVGGWFDAAGPTPVNGVVRWTGDRLEPVGTSPVQAVDHLVAYGTGSSRALYAGGSCWGDPSAIWRWNGATWDLPGGGLWSSQPWPSNCATVDAMEVHDRGVGPELFVYGWFDRAGALPIHRFAAWNGSTWSQAPWPPGLIDSMKSFDDGSGPQLFACGVGGVWRLGPNGWVDASLGAGSIRELDVIDVGAGPELFGLDKYGFSTSYDLFRWNGVSWSAVPDNFNVISLLTQIHVGATPRLCARVDGSRFATWDGFAWSQLSSAALTTVGGEPTDALGFDDGNGHSLFVVGEFARVNGALAANFAHFDGVAWGGESVFTAPNDDVNALSEFDDGAGRALFVGGDFTQVDNRNIASIARWSGDDWSALGSGLSGGGVLALTTASVGGAPALYVGGQFTAAGGQTIRRLARWDGSQWSAVGGNVTRVGGNAWVHTLLEHDDGSGLALFAGGQFDAVATVACQNIARWNGTSWSPLGAGVSGSVLDMAVFDDGGGPDLYVAGSFQSAGGLNAACIARWDGTAWSSLGTGTVASSSGVAEVRALAVYDDGSGAALYAGGRFSVFRGQPAPPLVRWRGGVWRSIGNFGPAEINDLRVFDDGPGPALFATGSGQLPQNSLLARWDGAWTQIAQAVPSWQSGFALGEFDDGTGASLILGGNFTSVTEHDRMLARYGCIGPLPPATFCLPTAPSTNGCLPRIAVTAHPSVAHSTPCTLTLDDLQGQANALLFYGVNGQQQRAWCPGGGSSLCVRPPFQALIVRNSGGTTGACDGALTEDWNAFQLAHPGALGAPWLAGAAVDIQGWFRDPAACGHSTLTEGVRVFYQ